MAYRTWISLVAPCGLVVIASLLGCGGGASGPTGTVNGKLTLNGQPAPTGTVVSFSSQESARTGQVSSDGTFTVMQIPVGEYKVSVTPAPQNTFSEDPKQAMLKAMENQQKGIVPEPSEQIPGKYQSIETSGISYEVKEGSNDFTLDMKE